MRGSLHDRATVSRVTPPEYVPAFPLDKLTLHPGNARRGDVDVVAESLRKHGQFKPLVVQRRADDGREFIVLAGNHTLRAMRHLGWDTCAVNLLDVNDADATRILLIDNRASDDSTYDDQALVALLEQLAQAGGLDGSGFDTQDLSDLVTMLNPPTVDDLADQYGEFDPASVWPVLRFKVPDETRDRFRRLTADVPGGDAEVFAWLLDRAEGVAS